MEWDVVLVLVTLIGLVTAILTPLLKLNTSITKLNTTIKNLDELVVETRNKIDNHIREGNEKFQDYEHRLTEHTVKIKNLEREVFNKKGEN